jgi:hypothetical protein
MKKIILPFLLAISLCINVYAGSQLTSSTTGTAFIALARAEYNDATTNTFSDTEILSYINDGVLDMAVKAQCIQDSESIDLAANTIEYSLSTDFIEVKGVNYVDSTGVIYSLKPGNIALVDPKNQEQKNSTRPLYWYEFDGKVGVYPALAARTTETITVYRVELPTAIAAGGTIPTPRIYDNALMLYCLYRMQRKDGNPEASNTYQRYLQDLGMYRQDLQDKVE